MIKDLTESFYSKEFYNNLAHTRKGGGFGFIALTAFFKTFLLTVLLFITMMLIPQAEIDSTVNQIPEVTIINGKVSINQPSPYYFTDDGRIIAIIDTSEAAAKRPADEIIKMLKNDDVIAYVTESTLFIYQKSKDEIKIKDLSQIKELKFDKEDVRKWVGIGKVAVAPTMAIFIYLGVVIYFIIRMLIYSVGAVILNNLMNRKHSYQTLQRLTSYALWPGILIGIVFNILSIDYWFIASLILSLGYIHFAIKSTQPATTT